MVFPRVSDQNLWKVVKREDYYMTLASGDRKAAGVKVVYKALGKIGKKTERVLELKFFRKSPAIQMWFRGDEKPELIRSRIMKEGKWVFGMEKAPVAIDALLSGGEFIGVRIEMKVDSGKTERVDIYKPGMTASEILRDVL